MNLILSWLEYIPLKQILSIKLDDKLNKIYNKQTKLDNIIIFDVEFLRLSRNNEQLQTINEMGGIILYKNNNHWHLVAIFHFNLPPQHKNINEIYLMMTKYNSLTSKTEKKNIELEDKLFESYSPISAGKRDKKLAFKINGYRLRKNKLQYDLFIKIINNVFNDKDYKKRLITNDFEFMKLTNILFSESYLIVKGKEDFKALNNHLLLLNIKPLECKHYFDIAIYNNFLFKKCESAELEKTYNCLDKLNFTKTYDKYFKIIQDFCKFKPHNPLVDSYLTWIIYNIFLLNKIKDII